MPLLGRSCRLEARLALEATLGVLPGSWVLPHFLERLATNGDICVRLGQVEGEHRPRRAAVVQQVVATTGYRCLLHPDNAFHARNVNPASRDPGTIARIGEAAK